MEGKYYSVSLSDEKAAYTPSDTSSITLLEQEQDLRVIQQRRKSILESKWLLLAHSLFFLFSLSVLLRGITFSAPTTERFVDEFSMYCEWPWNACMGRLLIYCTAPAVHVIEYEDVKFNGSMYATSPYIGKGPDVDAAWDVITYNGRSYVQFIHFSFRTWDRKPTWGWVMSGHQKPYGPPAFLSPLNKTLRVNLPS
jgi:hypothetical protein